MWDIVFIILTIFINVYILLYLYHLERIGCQCAMNWRRTYIMVFIAFSLIMVFLSSFDIDPLASATIMAVYSILSIIVIIIILQYVHLLKKEQCKCSSSVAREIMQAIAVLYAFLYIITFIVIAYNGFKLSTITSLSKTLSTNNPRYIYTAVSKTAKSVRKSIKK